MSDERLAAIGQHSVELASEDVIECPHCGGHGPNPADHADDCDIADYLSGGAPVDTLRHEEVHDAMERIAFLEKRERELLHEFRELKRKLAEAQAKNHKFFCAYCSGVFDRSEMQHHIFSCEKHPLARLSVVLAKAFPGIYEPGVCDEPNKPRTVYEMIGLAGRQLADAKSEAIAARRELAELRAQLGIRGRERNWTEQPDGWPIEDT